MTAPVPLTRADLARMSDAAILAAYQQGRLRNLTNPVHPARPIDTMSNADILAAAAAGRLAQITTPTGSTR